MTPCTLWYRRNPVEGVVYNHLADGHAKEATPGDRPAWARQQWERVHAWLTDELPAKVAHYSPDEIDSNAAR